MYVGVVEGCESPSGDCARKLERTVLISSILLQPLKMYTLCTFDHVFFFKFRCTICTLCILLYLFSKVPFKPPGFDRAPLSAWLPCVCSRVLPVSRLVCFTSQNLLCLHVTRFAESARRLLSLNKSLAPVRFFPYFLCCVYDHNIGNRLLLGYC